MLLYTLFDFLIMVQIAPYDQLQTIERLVDVPQLTPAQVKSPLFRCSVVINSEVFRRTFLFVYFLCVIGVRELCTSEIRVWEGGSEILYLYIPNLHFCYMLIKMRLIVWHEHPHDRNLKLKPSAFLQAW